MEAICSQPDRSRAKNDARRGGEFGFPLHIVTYHVLLAVWLASLGVDFVQCIPKM
jgi:hypothetical protein